MKITSELFDFVDGFNQGKDKYQHDSARCFYVLNGRNIEYAYYIGKKHTLAEARKIVNKLTSIMFEGNFITEYTGEFVDKSFNLDDYKKDNEFFQYGSSLFIA